MCKNNKGNNLRERERERERGGGRLARGTRNRRKKINLHLNHCYVNFGYQDI
jgi:hypothetical protein